jgi:hypothetical protein
MRVMSWCVVIVKPGNIYIAVMTGAVLNEITAPTPSARKVVPFITIVNSWVTDDGATAQSGEASHVSTYVNGTACRRSLNDVTTYYY